MYMYKRRVLYGYIFLSSSLFNRIRNYELDVSLVGIKREINLFTNYRISETMVSPIVQKRPQILAEQIPRNEFGETPEVARARIEHLRLLEEARRRNPPKVERDVMRVEYIPRKTRRQRTNDV